MAKNTKQDVAWPPLVEAYYATGDEQVLAPIFQQFQGLLASYVRGRLGVYDAVVVAEVVSNTQLVLLKALRAHTLDTLQNLWAWGCVAAKVELSSYQRLRATAPSRPGLGEDPFLLVDSELATPADALPENAEDERRAAATLARATQAMLALDPNARACVHLHFYKSVPVAAAAQQLGLSLGVFQDRLARGLAALRAWADQNPDLALNGSEYAALPRVNSGALFEDSHLPSPRELAAAAHAARTAQWRERRIAAIGREQFNKEHAVAQRAQRVQKQKKGPDD